MITQSQVDQFNERGFLVIENLLDEDTLEAVKKEYFQRMDELYAGWEEQGLVKPSSPAAQSLMSGLYFMVQEPRG